MPLDEAKRKKVEAAQTAEDLWKAIGVDSWVVVPIASVSRPGHDLEGTRLTVCTTVRQGHGSSWTPLPRRHASALIWRVATSQRMLFGCIH